MILPAVYKLVQYTFSFSKKAMGLLVMSCEIG